MKKDEETKKLTETPTKPIGLCAEIKKYGLRKALKTHRFHCRLRWILCLTALACACVGFLGFEFFAHTGLALAVETLIHHIIIETITLE